MVTLLEIDPMDVKKNQDLILVDVREPHELSGPEGHIPGVISAPLGTPFAQFLTSADPDQSYVLICRSGYRSAKACEIAQVYGVPKVYNMRGGMLAWNQKD